MTNVIRRRQNLMKAGRLQRWMSCWKVCLGAALLFLCAVGAVAARSPAPIRLNNFVVELADLNLRAEPERSTVEFQMVNRGWIFMELRGAGKGDIRLSAGTEDVVVLTEPGETMRYVPSGAVKITVMSHAETGIGRDQSLERLIVRRVPDIMFNMFEEHCGKSPDVDIKHSWERIAQAILPDVNMVVSRPRDVYKPYARRWQSRGGRWLVKQHMRVLRRKTAVPAAFFAGLLGASAWDGVMLDEIGTGDIEDLPRYADGLSRFSAMPDGMGKTVYFFCEPAAIDHHVLMGFAPSDETAVHGEYAMFCLPHGDTPIRARQIGVYLEPDTTYTFSAHLRAENSMAGRRGELIIIDGGWRNEYGRLQAPRGNSDWNRYEATFSLKSKSGGAHQVVLTGPESGRMLVDAVQLERGSRAGAFSTGEPNLLANPSFEEGMAHWMSGMRETNPLRDAVIEFGHGFVPEIYLTAPATEENALRKIHQQLTHRVAGWRKINGLQEHSLVALLVYDLRPNRWNVNRHPGVNSKVFLDMQMHALATGDDIAGLGGVGFWGAHYASLETLRWSGALFRHYCLEGNTERLSRDPYQLSHLVNPDFNAGLDGWTTDGRVDAVRVSEMPCGGLLDLRDNVPAGGWALRTIREAGGAVNSFAQPIRNLEIGRLYSLKLYSADQDYSNRLIPADISIEGCDVRPEREISDEFSEGKWSHVWKLTPSRAKTFERYWTMHFRIFRATDTEGRLIVTDVEPGTVYWDFVQIEPFFAGL